MLTHVGLLSQGYRFINILADGTDVAPQAGFSSHLRPLKGSLVTVLPKTCFSCLKEYMANQSWTSQGYWLSVLLRGVQRILWLNHCSTLRAVKPISYPVLQTVRVNQCHCPLVQKGQLLQNVAAGACYYGDGVIINFKPPWQTVEPY